MKKLILTAICAAVSGIACGQQISPFVVNSSGNNFSTSYARLSYNVGETAITKIGDPGTHITQGFLQPLVNGVSVKENSGKGSFLVFPNPASSTVNIRSEKKEEKLNVKLIDGVGRVVLQQQLTESPISVKELPNGIYQLLIFNNEQKVVEHKTITKID